MFQAHSVASYHKPFNTPRSQLVRSKNKTPLKKQCGVLYMVECGVCHTQCIGKTERKLGKRFKVHSDSNHPSSAIEEYINLTAHPVTLDLEKMLCNKDNKTRRKVREPIEIYKDGPALNRDQRHEIPSALLQLVSCDFPGQVE